METRWVGSALEGGGGGFPVEAIASSRPSAHCSKPRPGGAGPVAGLPGRGRGSFQGDPPARKVAGKLWLASGLGDAEGVPAQNLALARFPLRTSVSQDPPTWAKLEEAPGIGKAGADWPHVPPAPVGLSSSPSHPLLPRPRRPAPPPSRERLTLPCASRGRRRLHGAESRGPGRQRLYTGRVGGQVAPGTVTRKPGRGGESREPARAAGGGAATAPSCSAPAPLRPAPPWPPAPPPLPQSRRPGLGWGRGRGPQPLPLSLWALAVGRSAGQECTARKA